MFCFGSIVKMHNRHLGPLWFSPMYRLYDIVNLFNLNLTQGSSLPLDVVQTKKKCKKTLNSIIVTTFWELWHKNSTRH